LEPAVAGFKHTRRIAQSLALARRRPAAYYRQFHKGGRMSRRAVLRRRIARLQLEALEAREVPASVFGTVFEDVNYGGGPGRALADSAGIGRPAVRVELYDEAGSYLEATTTDGAGRYSFEVPAGLYSVRVVNSTVTSSRPGSIAGLWPVQTFRAEAASGTVRAVHDEVGGASPAAEDSGSKSSGSRLDDDAIEQSVSVIRVDVEAVGGVDFGFNFDTIVNANDAGQGSLRQFIHNSNALGAETDLAQSGLPLGFETSVFMVSQSMLASGVAVFEIASELPFLTGVRTRLDGATQTNNVGDTNPGALGAGGAVGVGEAPLLMVARPEVLLHDSGGITAGLTIAAADVTIRGLAVYGFGSSEFFGADIHVLDCEGVLIEHNVVGASAWTFASPAGADRSRRFGILAGAGDEGVIRNNLVGFTGQTGILLTAGAMGWTIEGNEVRETSWARLVNDGISIEAQSGAAAVLRNLVVGNLGHGIDTWTSAGWNTIADNTISGNGVGGFETNGIHLQGLHNTVARNLVFANYGPGIGVAATSSENLISQNSIFANGTIPGRFGLPATGQIGIDLLGANDSVFAGTYPFVTPNDLGDADDGGNGFVNAPVLEQVQATNGRLRVSGWARPGAVVELFIAEPDSSHFGEGKTYLITFVEGAGDDQSADASAYGPLVNGLRVGADNTNRFVFEAPLAALPALLSDGMMLTATATLDHSTSEFSGNAIVNATPVDLEVTLRASQRRSKVGTVITLTTTIRNRGPGASFDAVVLHAFARGLRRLSVRVSQGDFDWSRRQWNVGPLVPGTAAKATLRVRITSSGKKVVAAQAAPVLWPDVLLANNLARVTLLPAIPLRRW
jgi:trimeric autotransporter adhesin